MKLSAAEIHLEKDRHLIFMPIIGMDKKKKSDCRRYLSLIMGIDSDHVETILDKVDSFITDLDCRSEKRYDGVNISSKILNVRYDRQDWKIMKGLFQEIKIIHINHHYSTAENMREPFCKSYSIENGFYKYLIPRPQKELMPMLRHKRRKAKARPHTLCINHAVDASYNIYKATYGLNKPEALTKLVSDMRLLEYFIQNRYYKKSDKINAKGKSYETGQVYTPLNNLPSHMRKLIRFKKKPTLQIDIKSSHPTILYALMETDKDRIAWSELIKKDAYSILEGVDRSLTKNAFVRWLGGKSLNSIDARHEKESEEALRDVLRALDDKIKLMLPSSYHKLSEMRIGGKLNEQLSTLEAEVVNEVCKGKASAEPIHDCVLCSIDDLDELREKFMTTFYQKVGIYPTLTIEQEIPSNSGINQNGRNLSKVVVPYRIKQL